MNDRNIYIRTDCGALTLEGQCSLYDEANRPRMCGAWPDQPETQTPELCGYRKKGT